MFDNQEEPDEPVSAEELTANKAVMDKYSYIVKWGKYMQSFEYYIINQCYTAQTDNAPTNAIFKNDDGTWSTFDQINSQSTRRAVESY